MQRSTIKALFPSLLIAACIAPNAVWAENATIHVTGTITGSTCSLQTSSITLPIGNVDKSTFTGIGSTSPWSPNVQLVSAGCDASLVSMTFSGTADANDSSLFKATGGAEGVGIEVCKSGGSASGECAVPNDTSRPVTFTPAPAGQGYSFAARYVQTTDAITTGPGNATITVLITYT
ncbi:type 1 fimbrial protein [Dyella sp. M7H15-1]|uniref:fimbrial protein n=1 Tax=Dyella sp. M7H15-1 TaxID=2501295 RepID=UPI001004EF62|nr:fimbrial protein [Dyella sp. M7H15-1]QAU24788.1 type 1 fimbrial protein [Dyella sp. M7H15-1]